jgi:hypothetical protein
MTLPSFVLRRIADDRSPWMDLEIPNVRNTRYEIRTHP